MSDPVTLIEALEVSTGILALLLAYSLQVYTDREVDIKYWGTFYLVGCALVLTHLGIFIPDPQVQLWLKFMVVLLIFTVELAAAHWIWQHAEVPKLLNDREQ